ncbi:hypothetical protein BH11BAC3_BH11BAC3_26470 [soil metagenome]
MDTVLKSKSIKEIINIPSINDKINLSVEQEKALYEYLLLLSPEGFLRQRFITEKEYFASLTGNRHAIASLPHITLANFILSSHKQIDVVPILKQIAYDAPKLRIVFENYAWFPFHTMYINVKYKVSIKQLVRKITKGIKNHIKADKNKYPHHFILTPHLTVCKGLSLEEYIKSEIEYSGLTFSDSMIAKYMILLRRPIDRPEKYQEVGRFDFGGPESCDTTIQLKLPF